MSVSYENGCAGWLSHAPDRLQMLVGHTPFHADSEPGTPGPAASGSAGDVDGRGQMDVEFPSPTMHVLLSKCSADPRIAMAEALQRSHELVVLFERALLCFNPKTFI